MASGAAWDQGWALGTQRAQERHAHKQALSDQELEGKIGELIDQRKGIQAKLPTLLDEHGQPTPEYTAAMDALTKNAQDLRNIYHPQTNPSAVSRFGHLLTDALHITKPEDRIKKEAAKREAGAAADERTAQGVAAAAPLSPTQQATQTYTAQVNAKLAAIEKSGMSEENKERARQAIFGIAQKVNMRPWNVPGIGVQLYDNNDPDSIPKGATPYTNPTMANEELKEYELAKKNGYTGTIFQFKADSTKSKAMESQWIQAHYGGRDLAQLSPEEADQAIARYKEENTPTTTSTGQTLVYDQNNQPHIFTHTATSSKNFPGAKSVPGASPSPSVALPNGATTTKKTPADVKKEADKVRPKSTASPIGPALDFKKATPDITAANKKYQDAVGLVDYADRVKQHPDNAQEQRDLAIMMERTMSGRFQTAAYDLEVKNSGIANTFQQWLNDATTGALPPKILNNLIQAAHDYKDATAKEVEAAKGTTPDSGQGSDPDVDNFLNLLRNLPKKQQ